MTPMQNDSSRAHDERGTALILAIVFVFIVGILIVSLGGFAANALLTTSNARTERTSTVDAENVVTVAMQYLRYKPVSADGALVPTSECGYSVLRPPGVCHTSAGAGVLHRRLLPDAGPDPGGRVLRVRMGRAVRQLFCGEARRPLAR